MATGWRSRRARYSVRAAKFFSVAADGNRLFERCLRHHIIVPGYSPEMRHRPHHQIPRIQAIRRLAPGVEIFRDIDLWLDRGDDGIGDFVLNRKDVSDISVIVVRPDVASRRRVVELLP